MNVNYIPWKNIFLKSFKDGDTLEFDYDTLEYFFHFIQKIAI